MYGIFKFDNPYRELEIYAKKYNDISNVYFGLPYGSNESKNLFDRFIYITQVREIYKGYIVTIEDCEIIPFSYILELPNRPFPYMRLKPYDIYYRYKIYEITKTETNYYRKVSDYEYRMGKGLK